MKGWKLDRRERGYDYVIPDGWLLPYPHDTKAWEIKTQAWTADSLPPGGSSGHVYTTAVGQPGILFKLTNPKLGKTLQRLKTEPAL